MAGVRDLGRGSGGASCGGLLWGERTGWCLQFKIGGRGQHGPGGPGGLMFKVGLEG